MHEQIIQLLDQLRAIVGSQYQHLSFLIATDANGVTYTQSATDSQGNSISITDRRVSQS